MEPNSSLRCLEVKLPAWWQTGVALKLRVPSLNVNVVFADVAIKDWMKSCAFSVTLGSHYSVDAGSVILHKVPKPHSKARFIYGRTLSNLCNNRPDHRISIELLSQLAVVLTIDYVNTSDHVCFYLGLFWDASFSWAMAYSKAWDLFLNWHVWILWSIHCKSPLSIVTEIFRLGMVLTLCSLKI